MATPEPMLGNAFLTVFPIVSISVLLHMMYRKIHRYCTFIQTLTHSSFCALNFMLPAPHERLIRSVYGLA